MMYIAGFDVALISGLGTLTLTPGVGTPYVITISDLFGTDSDTDPSSMIWHSSFDVLVVEGVDGNVRGIFRKFAIPPLRKIVQDLVHAFAAGWTDPTDFELLWSVDDHYTVPPAYTFVYPNDGGVAVAWSTDVGRALFGFTANGAQATSQKGTATPTYVNVPTLRLVSRDERPYEPERIAVHMVDNNGEGYTQSRGYAPLYCDWVQEHTVPERLLIEFETATHPFSLQRLKQHCRSTGLPFYVAGGFEGSANRAFTLRTSGTNHKPQRRGPGDGTSDHYTFECIQNGIMVTAV